MKKGYFVALLLLLAAGCGTVEKQQGPDVAAALDYCVRQAGRTLAELPDYDHLPSNIDADSTHWRLMRPGGWTCGFWPGIAWYVYEYTGEQSWKEAAEGFTAPIIPVATGRADSHDVGFITYCSIGNGYRFTRSEEYKQAMLQAADSLATLYNPIVGTILSWPGMVERMDWPHNTIIDNLMNLELLFWAGKNGGDPRLAEIATRHAEVTMEHQFRADGSTYHVAVYDDETGEFLKGVTHQGYADGTMWARGQAWAIYGFTMAYRETEDERFRQTARRAADVFLGRLPEDSIPYWDFDDPGIPDVLRDASAAAVTASALLELSVLTDGEDSARYRSAAERMLAALSTSAYRSGETKPSFLLHSVGHAPRGSEIDASIIYADYYYIEALLRLKKLQQGKSIYENL